MGLIEFARGPAGGVEAGEMAVRKLNQVRVWVPGIAAVLALAATPATGPVGLAQAATPVTFSRETVVDPYRLSFEPSLSYSPDGTIYESPIFGFRTTQSFIQRSDDGGQTFNVLGLPGVGKIAGSNPPAVCTGGFHPP